MIKDLTEILGFQPYKSESYNSIYKERTLLLIKIGKTKKMLSYLPNEAPPNDKDKFVSDRNNMGIYKMILDLLLENHHFKEVVLVLDKFFSDFSSLRSEHDYFSASGHFRLHDQDTILSFDDIDKIFHILFDQTNNLDTLSLEILNKLNTKHANSAFEFQRKPIKQLFCPADKNISLSNTYPAIFFHLHQPRTSPATSIKLISDGNTETKISETALKLAGASASIAVPAYLGFWPVASGVAASLTFLALTYCGIKTVNYCRQPRGIAERENTSEFRNSPQL